MTQQRRPYNRREALARYEERRRQEEERRRQEAARRERARIRKQKEQESKELARGPVDLPFCLLVLLLTAVGLVMLLSASFPSFSVTFTSVTYPLSTSVSSSRSLKIRSAPAIAIITAFSCWLIWLMGILKLRLNVRKLASPPNVNPPMPFSASTPPTIAQTT